MRLIYADALKHSIAGNIPLMPTVRIAIEHIIDDMPTIEAEPVKHGRWIDGKVRHIKNGELRNMRECSECGALYFVYDEYNSKEDKPKYCPNCGAIMDKEADE